MKHQVTVRLRAIYNLLVKWCGRWDSNPRTSTG
jgi:hypothetical protein